MKKSLIALAALAATSAFAQSSVTLYGIVEVGADIGYNRTVDTSTSTRFTATNGLAVGNSTVLNALSMSQTTGGILFGPNTAAGGAAAGINGGTVVLRQEQKHGTRIQDGNDQGSGTSRVGFRGTEDLGGGLKANFMLEMGIRVDDGCVTTGAGNVCSSGNSGGNLFGRNAWGGISGGFGEVRVGRQVLGSFGVQANSWSAGSSNGLYDAASGNLPMGGVRFSNAIRYLTPRMSGFGGSIMLAAPETEGFSSTSQTSTPINTGVGVITSTGAARRTGVDLALDYSNGPAYIGFGYNVQDAANTGSSFATTNAAAGVGVSSGFTPGKVTAWTLGGSYNFGVVRPFINYTRQNTQTDRTDSFTPVAGGFGANIRNNNEVNAHAWSVGLRAPVGAVTVIAGYGRLVASGLNNVVATQNNAIQGNTTAHRISNEQRRNSFQLGAQYALSKRTSLQANYGYSRLQNDTTAVSTNNFLAASGVQTVSASDRISALNVGLKHSF